MTNKPISAELQEALQLAADLSSIFISEEVHATKARKIAAELRRLHQSEREGWRHADELKQDLDRLHAQVEALSAAQEGTPAPVGVEPVAWRVRRLDSPNYWIIFLHKPVDALMDLKREVQPLYTTPQPTQAQAGAVPLTDEQLWANDEIMSLNADLGWHMETIRMFARAIERAHGITGGQHGAE